VVKILVEMLEPYRGRIYDPCCGSGGMFVQSKKFVEAHQGRAGDIHVFGQESNSTTWRLCRMNLAIRGIDGDIGEHHADSFHNDLHKSLKADYILANPPFNIHDWGGERLLEDMRWKYGIPPVNNANYAWIEHMIFHLAPSGTTGFVLANGSMATNTNAEANIRKNIIEADLVDVMVTLPSQLFYSAQIPVCLWFITRNKAARGHRDRKGEILFIDARKLGYMEDRVHRNFSDEDIQKISDTYHSWRGEQGTEKYKDIKGFCKSAKLEEVREHECILTPGRYVGIEDIEDDGEPFEDKMERLTPELAEQFAKSRKLEDEIRENLKGIGYEF
jgi:type I restriction enzyme M protein